MGFRPLVTCQRYLRHCLSVRGALPRRIPPRVRKWRMKNLGDSWPTGGLDQVWSLTQFYSVVFSKSRIGVKKVRCQQTHNQGLRQLLLTVSWELRA